MTKLTPAVKVFAKCTNEVLAKTDAPKSVKITSVKVKTKKKDSKDA